MVLETNPGDQRQTERKIEESFIGDGQDDENGREGEEDDHQPV